jgi:LPS O-antigen subunit length determinant protein (WzzB/FepE family)
LPDEVRQAKRTNVKISLKAEIGDAEEEFDLETGFTEEAEKDDDEIALSQPSQEETETTQPTQQETTQPTTEEIRTQLANQQRTQETIVSSVSTITPSERSYQDANTRSAERAAEFREMMEMYMLREMEERRQELKERLQEMEVRRQQMEERRKQREERLQQMEEERLQQMEAMLAGAQGIAQAFIAPPAKRRKRNTADKGTDQSDASSSNSE